MTLLKEISLSYDVTENDYENGMKLWSKGTFKLWRNLFIGFLLIAMLYFSYFGINQRSITDYMILISISLIFQAIYSCFLLPYKARRQYRQLRIARESKHIVFTNNGLKITSESINSNMLWEDILHWKKSNEVYLLYLTGNSFYNIPARAVTDKKAFEALLNDKIKQRL